MSTKIIAFHVEFRLPCGATIADAMEYIEAALKTECGMRHPEDPMHDFDRDSIDIRPRAELRK